MHAEALPPCELLEALLFGGGRDMWPRGYRPYEHEEREDAGECTKGGIKRR